ncbi:mitogen-activated protein kinase kinase kinase [Coemansia sp. RSA 2610]|nr:mitogen-activated protein kinase kinase kinase [Coemansia sp. RSA 2610]
MEARLVRRDPQSTTPSAAHPARTTDSTARPAARANESSTRANDSSTTANLASANIPVDAVGNPLPWSRESVVRWAQKNGFAKFVPSFLQYGIEGYRFYTLRLEEMRGMKIPGVTMQDLIQLNAAIYRLNVACATPAGRSHMTGTVRVPPASYRPPANSVPQTYNYGSQILSRPLQPLRPPRPSWTLRHDDPQPTHVHQLTSNGMVARPMRRPGAPAEVPFAIDTSTERAPRYGTAKTSTYRSRNSAHVEVDELPLVRPGPSAWGRPPQPQPSYARPVRRRSAVIDVRGEPSQSSPVQRTPSGASSATSPASASQTLPARYHGTNHAHSPYYAHGASGSPAHRPSPVTARSVPPVEPRPKARAPVHAAFRPPRGDAQTRRTSISPVLSALQPGNYHIANLPDDLDDSSDVTNSSSDTERPAEVPLHVLAAQHKLAQAHARRAHHGLPELNTAAFLNEFRTSPCETGDSIVTPLSVVNVLPGMFSSDMLSSSTSPSQHSRADSAELAGTRARLQRAFSGDTEDLPGSQRSGHVRTPSAPLSFPMLRQSTAIELPEAGARPRSSTDMRPSELAIFDAASIASTASSEASAHFDLVENAAPIPGARDSLMVFDADEIVDEPVSMLDAEDFTKEPPMVLDADELVEEPLSIFDAEEIDGESPAIFDAEEICDARSCRSSVLVDAYEVESILAPSEEDLQSAFPVPVKDVASGQPDLDEAPEQAPLVTAHEQSPTFKLKGVRQVLSYDEDFDKTAATLLSSIKTDIARKGAASSSEAARIAAAIEHHQQKQQQQRQRITKSDEGAEPKHTSRLSGLFGFGQRSQPRLDPSAGLRVVTDLQALRSHSAGNSTNNNINTSAGEQASSAEGGRKSSSPSTVSRRWRVPFRQRPQTATAQADETEPRRTVHRRSRYRAGTTSDIESPHTTAARIHAGDRPSSMVESGSSSSASPSAMAHVVLARTESSGEYVPINIARLVSGASVAERLVRTLHPPSAEPLSPGRWRFAAVAPDGSLQPVASDSDLWVHCVRARSDRPAKFVVCDSRAGHSASSAAAPVSPMSWLRRADSDSDSGSEICSAMPFAPPRMPAAAAESPVLSAGSSLSPVPLSGDIDSPSSFMTARSNIPAIEPSADSDSWTLMFFNKEFVVPRGVSGAPSQATLALSSASEPPSAAAADDREDEQLSVSQSTAVGEQGDDDLLWGGAAPKSALDEDDSEAAAVRADLAGRAPSQRELPSTMRFTRGMRATLLKQPSTKAKVRQRPTADVIGEQLDEYFPDHDLDRPIVQAVPVDDERLPSQEFHIILDEEYNSSADKQQQQLQLRKQQQQQRSADDTADNRSNVARRKSVRMLVQETRQRRGPRNRSRPVQRDQRPELGTVEALASISEQAARPQTSGVVRRKSTRLWGCVPEEIRPRTARRPRPGETAGSNGGSNGLAAAAAHGSDEIVRRALSLLRKPEPNPEAEKEIVEAAMRCEDSRAAGSTRAQFVQSRDLQRRGIADVEAAATTSVSATVQSLFAKYKLGPGGVRFQWIRGKLIGRGSFGHVYVAINAGTGEVIAVKQIRLPTELRAPGRAGGSAKAADAVQMMQTEVELLRDLDHENIVQLLGFEVAAGLMSMFLEYVPGGTVQSLVQQHGPLPEAVVHSFVAQVAAGLAYLHERAILHRDIKGANILVDHTGTCKISDFGISRKLDPSSVAAAAAEGSAGRRRRVLGTVPFMAPEVARASAYSAAADIWALGCLVVQMWSGQQPWDALQEPQVFFKLGRGEAPPVPDDLTEAGLEFCKRCLAGDPQARWTAPQLAELKFAQVPQGYEYPY